MLERLKLPGLDAHKLIDGHRNGIEALLAANERTFAAIEELRRKQAELLADVTKEWRANAKRYHDNIADFRRSIRTKR
jgi:hypothetical protein